MNIKEVFSQKPKYPFEYYGTDPSSLPYQHEYLRLRYHYYRNTNSVSRHEYFNSSEVFGQYSPLVYGKYFLFKNWLEEQLEMLNEEEPETLSSEVEDLGQGENRLLEKIKEHFDFLRNRGRKNEPMMDEETFLNFVSYFQLYCQSNFSIEGIAELETSNVKRNEFIVGIKVFINSELGKQLPKSLPEFINKFKQSKWKMDIDMNFIHKQSTRK